MPLSRNALHEKAMIIIYDALTYEAIKYDFDVQEVISDILETPYEDTDLYLRRVVVKAILHKEKIIEQIEPYMNNWPFKRINRLAQAIILLSVTHYQEVQEVSKAIVIDIAVRLAKKYLDDSDYKYINGVLDKCL